MARDDTSICILRKVLIDIIMIGGLTLCVLGAKHLWVPFKRGFFCGDQTLMFPYKSDTVTVLMLRLFGLGLPLLAFILCEWAYLRKEKDDKHCFGIRIPMWLRGFYCAAMSFSFGVLFTELTAQIAKNIIGRPRPHFFDVCKPSIDCSSVEFKDKYIQTEDYSCLGDNQYRLLDMRMSFPSGHSSWAAFSMIYLALYLEHRQIYKGTRALRHALSFTAVMISWFTALSRVSDYKHHWSDVLAGYFLGLTFAILMWMWGTALIERKPEHSAVPQQDITLTPQQMAVA